MSGTLAQDVAGIRPVTRRTDAAEVAVAAYAQLDGLLRGLTPGDWPAQTACPGWSVADMVGHLIGAAEGNASILEFTRQFVGGLRHRGDHGGNPLDATNARQIDDHRSLPDDERAAALRAVAPAAIRGCRRLSTLAGRLSVPISGGGSAAAGMPRSVNLGRLFDVVYTRDVWMHTMDIADATGRPLTLTAPVNARLVADVVREWCGRHRQPVDLTLTGGAGGRYRQGSAGPEIELDALDFCRILSGRVEGDGLLGVRVLF